MTLTTLNTMITSRTIKMKILLLDHMFVSDTPLLSSLASASLLGNFLRSRCFEGTCLYSKIKKLKYKFHFLSNIGIKIAGLHILVSSWQMLLVRCVGQSIGMLPLILWTRSPILASPDLSTRWRLAAQAVIGGLLLLSIFEAVQRLPIGDCTAIFFSTPTVTLILSTFLLKDHCGLYRYFI